MPGQLNEQLGPHDAERQDFHESIGKGKSVFPVGISGTEPEVQTSDGCNESEPFPDAGVPSVFFEQDKVNCPKEEIK